MACSPRAEGMFQGQPAVVASAEKAETKAFYDGVGNAPTSGMVRGPHAGRMQRIWTLGCSGDGNRHDRGDENRDEIVPLAGAGGEAARGIAIDRPAALVVHSPREEACQSRSERAAAGKRERQTRHCLPERVRAVTVMDDTDRAILPKR